MQAQQIEEIAMELVEAFGSPEAIRQALSGLRAAPATIDGLPLSIGQRQRRVLSDAVGFTREVFEGEAKAGDDPAAFVHGMLILVATDDGTRDHLLGAPNSIPSRPRQPNNALTTETVQFLQKHTQGIPVAPFGHGGISLDAGIDD